MYIEHSTFSRCLAFFQSQRPGSGHNSSTNGCINAPHTLSASEMQEGCSGFCEAAYGAVPSNADCGDRLVGGSYNCVGASFKLADTATMPMLENLGSG